MQVTHERDHVTHAVIGGKNTINFGISDSPEFFNILSSTLYSDQMLAVVREVLCNAWDAHIDAGITSRPVEVTFKDDMFIVRDYGKGIHHDSIGPIYGTYGNSTKKNDGKQTGGFGLGCKAPFAYTDHFEVTSYHQGTMTIYAMSKSSGEVSGKPGITPVVSLPSTESGLQVAIKIKNASDKNRFKHLVQTIAFNGDMFVVADGGILPKLNFTDESVFLIQNIPNITPLINVRYGNVIYPVTTTAEIASTYTRVVEIINNLSRVTCLNIVFQAPPHSIAVTPSRESLSMQEHTCKTLNTLFSDFIANYNKNFQSFVIQANKKQYTNMASTVSTSAVVDRDLCPVGGYNPQIYNNPKPIRTIEQAADTYVSNRYPSTWKYRKTDIQHRAEFLLAHNKADKNLTLSYLRELDRIPEYQSLSLDSNRYFYAADLPNHTWLRNYVIKPLVSKMLAEPSMDMSRLYLSDKSACVSEYRGNVTRASQQTGLIPVKRAVFTHMPAMLPYVRNIVVLAYSRLRFMKEERIAMPDGSYFSQGSGFFVYIVERRKGDFANAHAFFTKRGMIVVDYTAAEEVELRSRPTSIRKSRRAGLPTLSAVYKTSANRVCLSRLKDDTIQCINDPLFYVRGNIRKDSVIPLEGIPSDIYQKIIPRYGSRGVIITTTRQEDAYIKKGLPHFSTFITQDVIDYITNSQAIQEYWAYNHERIREKTGHKDVMDFILTSPYLVQKFKLEYTLPEIDKAYLELMDIALTRFPRNEHRDELLQLYTTMQELPLATEATKAINKIEKSVVSKFLSVPAFRRQIADAATEEEKQEIYTLFLKLLNI